MRSRGVVDLTEGAGTLMILAIPKETFPGEKRVALIPASLAPLVKVGFKVLVETGAGIGAGHSDEAYVAKGAEVVTSRAELFKQADAILQVRAVGANPHLGRNDFDLLKPNQIVIAMADPLWRPDLVREFAQKRASLYALELVPRTTRAQSMDVLSSMATIAGYKGVLLAATHLSKIFPMFMTAAGTITPSRVFVVGAGVAGLQAIATARRLGAVVQAYDVRPAVKEQVLSLGAKFVELALDTGASEDKGGYAKAQDEAFYTKQREMMMKVVAESDVVVTTAAIPGKRSPILVTRQMVEGMAAGSVIIDLAAERGGNCELTKPDETVVEKGVIILGPANLPSTVAQHSSQLFAKNVQNFLLNMVTKEGQLRSEADDDILRETLVVKNGEILHPGVKEAASPAPAAVKA